MNAKSKSKVDAIKIASNRPITKGFRNPVTITCKGGSSSYESPDFRVYVTIDAEGHNRHELRINDDMYFDGKGDVTITAHYDLSYGFNPKNFTAFVEIEHDPK